MNYRVLLVILVLSVPAQAQISQAAKYDILRTVLADTAAARIALPFGSDGVELSDSGQINKTKLAQDMQKNGQSVEAGKAVTVTDISFDDHKINIELDGGGKNKKGILDRIQIGMGTDTATAPIGRADKTAKAKGSKIVLRFAGKVPPDLKPAALRELLSPILDFNKHTFMKTGLESLPPEFQEAVKAKEAQIGMDKSTVIMALGRPDNRFRETRDGVFVETWLYDLRGLKRLFIAFENNIVVQIKKY